MPDCVASIFRLSNARGYRVPALNVDYQEENTGIQWRLTCGGTRGYTVRVGDGVYNDLNEEAADSHFMIKRITSSLLLGRAGLFQAEAVGRILFRSLPNSITWDVHLDAPEPFDAQDSEEVLGKVYDWCEVLCQSHVLRRAADDAHLALSIPHEALVFVYRGLEWLKAGQGIKWENIASDLGISMSQLKGLKKTANYESGVRHATETGNKMRACPRNYGTWVCGLIDGINRARQRLDPGFTPMTPEEVSGIVERAMLTVPYP